MIISIQGVDVDLVGVTQADIDAIEKHLGAALTAKEKGRVAISEGFRVAIDRCPEANASDLWHHVVYRAYLRLVRGPNPNQSWVRTSGDAFESFLAHTYNEALAAHGRELVPLFDNEGKALALADMGITGQVGGSKLDLAIYEIDRLRGKMQILGAVHAKVSLAERVSDDVPASQIIMKAGYASFLATLDVKSFPPPRGDLVNRGELGTPAAPSDKRKYVEEHGSFTNCYSYNDRTQPSVVPTKSGRLVFVTHAADPVASHQLFKDIVALK